MRDDILTLAASLAGASEGDRDLLERLCDAAADHWASRSRVDPEDCREAFVFAAACSAAGALAELRGTGDVSGFSAGDLSVRFREGGGSGFHKMAEAWMAPFARPVDLWFRGVLS